MDLSVTLVIGISASLAFDRVSLVTATSPNDYLTFGCFGMI